MKDFQDPDLSAAVRQAWGGERAPGDLRDRVATLLAAERASAARASARASDRFRRPLARWAAAAAVVAAAGLAGVMAGRGPTRAGSPAVASVLPASLEAALVQTHDQCCRGGADHQRLPVPQANGYAIAASLRSRLDRPVLVSHPADAGWRFAGASVCAVGRVDSAHLVFRRRDGDALSIFSLPRSAAPAAADGQQFQAVVQTGAGGHPVVGFVGHGAVYCLVGSGCATDVSVPRLADIRRQLERQVVVADAAAPLLPAGRELIYGTGR